MREARASCVHYLGVMPPLLMAAEPSPSDRDHAVRFGFGAGVTPALHAPFEARFGFPLVETWAMTETGAGGSIIAQVEPRHVGTACFGRPRREVEARIVAEDGSDAERGELLVRRAGPDPRTGFFDRYLHDPEASEAAWAGGWFHTGDMARRGPDGSLHFVDRIKNVIRRSGENVSAAEVEAVLREHAEVEDVGVAAAPDDLRGDEVFACVVSGGRGRPGRGGADRGLGARAHGLPQGAGLRGLRGRAARHLHQQAPARGAARDGPALPGRGGARSARAQEAHGVRRQPYDGVAVCCPVSVPYERHSIRTAHHWIARALRALCDAAGVEPSAIDGLSASSFTLAPDTPVGLVEHLGLSPRWLDSVPTGGASGVMALRRAARAVQAGDAAMVACVAGDTHAPGTFRGTLAGFSRFAQDASYPYGAGGPNTAFALLTDHYMTAHGAEPSDFGRICVAQRANAAAYPHALMREPLTLDAYLASPRISDPILLYDCVMPCAGAEAFLVTHEETAARLGLPHARVLSTIERHNAHAGDAIQGRGGWSVDAGEMWEMAGIGPGDVDVIETYDDYPVIVMLQFEDLGFCAKGEGRAFVRAHDLTTGGDRPHNTSGGQLSVGQAGAAGGYLGLVEGLRQVTGRALGAQVEGARRALVSGFGVIAYDRGVCSAAAILEGAA